MRIFGLQVMRAVTLARRDEFTDQLRKNVADGLAREKELSDEVGRLTEALWLAQDEGYEKADGSAPSIDEYMVVSYHETRSGGSNKRYDLDCTVDLAAMSSDLHDQIMRGGRVEFRGVKWVVTQASTQTLSRLLGRGSFGADRSEVTLNLTGISARHAPPPPSAHRFIPGLVGVRAQDRR